MTCQTEARLAQPPALILAPTPHSTAAQDPYSGHVGAGGPERIRGAGGMEWCGLRRKPLRAWGQKSSTHTLVL